MEQTGVAYSRCSLVLADLLVASVVSMVALVPSRATPSGAIDSGDAAWMIIGRGSGDPNPLIMGPLFRLIADRCDDLAFCRCSPLDVCGCLVLLVAIK